MLGSSSTIRIRVIALDPPSFHEQLLTTVVAAGLPRHKANHGGVKPPLRRSLISTCSRTQRQSNDKLAALAGRALYRDLSSVGADNVAHQGKPQAAPLGVVNQR